MIFLNKKKVVITGLGVVAPNGVGLDDFTHAIKMEFRELHDPELERLQFSCQIAGNLRFLLNLRCAILN
jgi:hypothetical protein